MSESCEKIQELVIENNSGELELRDAELMRAHLAACGECRREAQEFAETWDAFHALPSPNAPEEKLRAVNAFATWTLARRHFSLQQVFERPSGVLIRKVAPMNKLKIGIAVTLFAAIVWLLALYLSRLPSSGNNTPHAAPPPSPQQVAALVAQLADPNEKIADAAAAELKRIGAPVATPLAAAQAAAVDDPALQARMDAVLDVIKPVPAAPDNADAQQAPAPNPNQPQEQANVAPPKPLKPDQPVPPPPKPDAELEKKIAALITQLGDLTWTKRYEATQALHRIGKFALLQLTDALNSPDKEISHRADLLVRAIRGEQQVAVNGVTVNKPELQQSLVALLGEDGGVVVFDGEFDITVIGKNGISTVRPSGMYYHDHLGIIFSDTSKNMGTPWLRYAGGVVTSTVNYERRPAQAKLMRVQASINGILWAGLQSLHKPPDADKSAGGIVTLDSDGTVKVFQPNSNGEPKLEGPKMQVLNQQIGGGQVILGGFGQQGENPAANIPATPMGELAAGDLMKSFGAKLVEAADGLRVVDVKSSSPASKAGLKAGDLLTLVNGRQAAKLDDVKEFLVNPEAGKPIMLEVTRKNESVTLTVPPSSPKEEFPKPQQEKP